MFLIVFLVEFCLLFINSIAVMNGSAHVAIHYQVFLCKTEMDYNDSIFIFAQKSC